MSKQIKISSFYLSAFLIAKGFNLISLERESSSSSKFLFVFTSTTTVEDVVQSFNFASEESDEVVVDARKMIFAIKKLKEVLYQSRL